MKKVAFYNDYWDYYHLLIKILSFGTIGKIS